MSNYQPLSQVIDLTDLPDEINWMTSGLSSLLSNVYLIDYQHFSDSYKNSSNILVTLRVEQGVNLEEPVSGLILALNPAFDPSSGVSSSQFVLKCRVDYGLIGIINSFTSNYSSFTNLELLQVASEIFNISTNILLREVIVNFSNGSISDFTISINSTYSSNVSTTFNNGNITDDIFELTTRLEQDSILANKSVLEIISDVVVSTSANPVDAINTIINGSSTGVAIDVESSVLKAFIPRIRANLLLSPELLIPRSWLIPMHSVNGTYQVETDTNVLSSFTFGSIDLKFDTFGEFGFETEIAASLKSPYDRVLIPNTGLSASFNKVQVDMSNNSNLSYASQLGYNESFKGIYASEISIYLPDELVESSGSTAQLSASRVLIGGDENSGIEFSGDISFTTEAAGNNLELSVLNSSVEISLNSLNISFLKGTVTSSNVVGTIKIAGLKDSTGQDANLKVNLNWNESGYSFEVSEPDGIPLTIPDVVTFTLNELTIGQINDKWQFTVKGRIERLADIPLLGDVVPKYMDVNHFTFNEGAPNDFELVFGWESDDESGDDVTVTMTEDGLSGPKLTREIPVNKDFLGLLTVEVFKYTLELASEKLTITTTIDAKMDIGPIKGHVEGAGFVTEIDFPSGGGNVGPANVSFDLAQPTGMGLSMDTSDWGFSLSGYLSYDEDKDQYAGAVDIGFSTPMKDSNNSRGITLSAYGLLNLTLPNGESGFSLLIVISTEFNPGFPIGFGFELEGVGGLLGLHRTMNTEPLRLGVKDGSLDDLLFPAPPIADRATQIFSLLENAFPVQKDQFVFGPMARITWGGDMIYADFGLLIEVDDPFRIVILGVVKATLPSKDVANLKLQVNFLGEINFAQEYITFDASLYNSELMSLPLLGDMVLRILWGDNGGFLLSVGGLHPSFVRPTNMMLPTTINRLSLSIVNKEKVKVYGSAYFATTSNTVQFGAGAKLYVKFWDFTVDGEVGLDALIFFRPKFQFITRFYATFSVKYKRWDLLGVGIDCTLEGPSPFHLFGNGEIKILGVGISFDFDETFGDEDTRSIPSIDVGEKLTESLEDINLWNTTIPARNQLSVTLRQLPAGAGVIQLHPLGNLRVSQKTVPLGIEIQRFGNSDPEGTKLFDITGVTVQSNPIAHAVVNEQFAPAQFFHIAKTQVLKEASFRDYKGGVELNFTNADELGFSRLVSAEYLDPEVIVIDGPNSTATTVLNRHTAAEMDRAFEGSSSSNFFDTRGKYGSAKSLRGTQKVNKLDSNLFVTVDSDGVQQGSGTFESVESAQSWIDQELLSNSGIAEDELTVVSLADLNAFSNF